jgi:hypothetical protein
MPLLMIQARRLAESVRGQIIASRRKAGDVEYPEIVFRTPTANLSKRFGFGNA